MVTRSREVQLVSTTFSNNAIYDDDHIINGGVHTRQSPVTAGTTGYAGSGTYRSGTPYGIKNGIPYNIFTRITVVFPIAKHIAITE